MRIAITGSTGLIGRAVVAYFEKEGHAVTRIVRSRPSSPETFKTVLLDMPARRIDRDALEGHDVIIHLAGENIAGHRWTKEFKDKIFDSRIIGTSILCDAIVKLKSPPKILLSASAVGYYGHCASINLITEDTLMGDDFLAHVCEKWEAATNVVEIAKIRVVHMRFGTILSSQGGALAKMLPIFKLGLGGKLGLGEQMFSWIALSEIPLAMTYVINNPSLSGAVNFVAPNPVTNFEFTKILGKIINRPTIFPVPSLAVRLMFGEMGQTLLLNGARVLPKKLLDSGYQFRYADLESALKATLG